jgi:minor extracellular serine protease Vpr
MVKRVFAVLMCLLFVANGAYARYPNREEAYSYIVVLKEPPLSQNMLDRQGRSLYKGIAARRNRHHERASRRRVQMEEKLIRFEDRLKRISPRIVRRRRFTGLLNGVSIETPKDYVSRIRSLPEVLSIVPNRKYHFSLNKSNDLMNAPLMWELVGGQEVAGQGIKIGIIDTGIDNTHPMFDDAGFVVPEGFPLGDPNFTNKKIIVARVFTKNGDTPEDSTPRDRNGHGTHVASVAAGDSNTLSPLGLISGLAPQAQLGNYKVFTGDFTTLEQIVAALEACVEDGMDVVNMSLGSESYINTILDPEALAIRNAIKAGVVVVAAAGNSGVPEAIGSPGQIPEVITVGSVTNAHDNTSISDINIAMMNVYSDGEQIVADEQVILGPDPNFFTKPLLGRFQIIDADALDGNDYGGDSDGLVCEDLPAGSAQDKWVLVQRGICTFSDKIDRVQQAGGWGALIYNRAGAEEGPNEPVQGPSVDGTMIPSYFVSRHVGLIIKEVLAGTDVVEVEFYTVPPHEDILTPFELSYFSSLGPSLDYVIKPEITAIGEGCYAATQNDLPGQFQFNSFTYTSFDLSGFGFSSGTSFSSPRIAGVAAIIKQANPSWKPKDVKSAIVTTAERKPSLAPLSAMERGGGHVNAAGAMEVPVIVTPATLSYDNVMIDDVTEVEKTIQLENISQQPQSVSLSLEQFGSERVQSVEIFPVQVDLAPTQSTEISLKVTFIPPDQLGDSEEINSDVIVTIAGQSEPLRVPVWGSIMYTPVVQGNVLLVDDDGGGTIETKYIESINLAGYEVTLWDVAEMQTYPSVEYMKKFQAVSWFLATTSLFNIRNRDTLSFNERTRFNVTLTRYLAQGGRLLVTGMDWSDDQEETLFGQQVLHISEFVHDPFVQYSADGDVASQETLLDISGLVDSPISQDLPDLEASFDSDVANMSDTLMLDNSGIAKPALITNQNPEEVIGITVETGSYRAVFFSFALERVQNQPRQSVDGMTIIIKNSLDWLMNGQRKLLSIQSVEPNIQTDNSVPKTIMLTVEGMNFSLGYDVRLNNTPLEIAAIDLAGSIEVIIPAGLPNGLYDIALDSPDGQSNVLPDIFTIQAPTNP